MTEKETIQAYFDKTINHLRTQGKRADSDLLNIVSGDCSCSYLTPSGLKCAIGIHIPNGHPAQQSTFSISKLTIDYPELEGIAFPEGEGALAAELQLLHDANLSWDETGFTGEPKAEAIARSHGLTYTAPVAA